MSNFLRDASVLPPQPNRQWKTVAKKTDSIDQSRTNHSGPFAEL